MWCLSIFFSDVHEAPWRAARERVASGLRPTPKKKRKNVATCRATQASNHVVKRLALDSVRIASDDAVSPFVRSALFLVWVGIRVCARDEEKKGKEG